LFGPFGNDLLEKEEARSWEVGIDQELKVQGKAVNISVTWYDMDVDNRIEWDFSTFAYGQALGGSQSSGLELVAELEINENWTAYGRYDFTETTGPNGMALARRAKNSGVIGVMYNDVDNQFNFEAMSVGGRPTTGYTNDSNGNPVAKLEKYTILNVQARHNFSDSFSLFGRVDNILDKKYENAFGYGTGGRQFVIGLEKRF
jgi:vitamin B12 transporter